MSVSEARARSVVRVSLALLICTAAVSCVPWQLSEVLDGPQGKALALAPASTVLLAGSSLTFSASGGIPPYTYTVVSGSGATLDPNTGAFASVTAGTVVVSVTDKTGNSRQATVTVQASGSLSISPLTLSVMAGGSFTFAAIGGATPYTYTMQSSGSGSPSVTAGGGLYVAGASPGTDQVKVTDNLGATSTATVTVTTVASAVDYTVPATSLPGAGIVNSAVPGGAQFTLKNNGTGNGSQPVSWEAWLSADATIGSGDFLVGSGTTGALSAGGSAAVTVTGTLGPLGGQPGPYYLIVRVSAADDTTPANNTSTASAITLGAANVDYTVTSVANGGPLISGQTASGTLTIHNGGSADGTQQVAWKVYASTDTTLNVPGDYLVDSGTITSLVAGGNNAGIPWSGLWPSTPGTWYLIATVSALDDVAAGNNSTPSGSLVTSGPAPAAIDYTVLNVLNTGGVVAGDPLSGSFQVHNGGTDPGAQPVSWTAYLSLDATLQVGTDIVIDSGTTSALAAGATSASPISFHGTWPSTPGSWRLIVSVSASDDIVPTNNAAASGATATAAPSVDYTVQSISSTGGTTAGSALTGSLVLRNGGTHGGTQFVPYAVYLSSDAVFNVGTDQLISTGSLASPGLIAGASSSALPINSTWPASSTPKTWYLIAVVGAGDDTNATNDVVASASVLVSPPNIDYTVTVVNNTGATTGGAGLAGNFTIKNSGTAGGSASVTWTAYISPDVTLDLSDIAIATGTVGALGAGATNGPIGFSGTWPAGAATWFLIVRVAASDDVNGGNDYTASSAVAVTLITPLYTITSVPLPTGSTTNQAVSGTFTIQNGPGAAGASAINWQVYASLGDAVYNAGDVLIASGSTPGLGASGSSSPAWAGNWPSTAGTWYIVVRASAADAPAIADAASPSVVVSNPPSPDYTVSFNAAIPWSGVVGTLMSLTGTPQVTITNTSTNVGHSTINWAVYISTDNVLDGSDTIVASGTNAPLGSLGSVTKSFDANWPAAPGRIYWFIARVGAADDLNPTNDTVPSVHAVVTGDYRYAEGAENNNAVGPSPNPAQTSTTGATTLGANQVLVLEGTMDNYNKNDTYAFTTVASMSRLSMRALWATGFDDIDLYLWDDGTTNLDSIEVGINSEPGNGTFDVTGVTPRNCYVSAYFYLNGNTSGSTGQKYVIWVKGLP